MVLRGEMISSRREDGSRETSLARFESDALHQFLWLSLVEPVKRGGYFGSTGRRTQTSSW